MTGNYFTTSSSPCDGPPQKRARGTADSPLSLNDGASHRSFSEGGFFPRFKRVSHPF
jgi:hypothetical protein